jgi:arylsulfatase A-like enzyme
MISVDTTRVEDLGWFSGLDTTPRLDALFAAGVVLEDHRSCSNWTFASVMCFQGGAYDLDQGFVPSAEHDVEIELPPDSLLQAAEVLGDAGWTSKLITTNNFLSSQSNNAQGFDEELMLMPHEGDATSVTEEGIDSLDELASSGDPWFLHVHYLDPHSPYDPPDEYLDGLDELDPIDWDLTVDGEVRQLSEQWDSLDSETQALVRQHLDIRYRAELSYVDAQIGALIDAAEAGGYMENTLVVFWTDHGEQLADHGEVGHDRDLYEELNRSVVAFYSPDLEPGVWTGPTTHGDIWPTILEALPWDFESPMPGEPLGTRGDDEPRYGLKYMNSDDNVMFVEQGGEKLIYYWDGRVEFYNLAEDPDEMNDLFDADDETVQSLWGLLEERLALFEEVRPDTDPADPGI